MAASLMSESEQTLFLLRDQDSLLKTLLDNAAVLRDTERFVVFRTA